MSTADGTNAVDGANPEAAAAAAAAAEGNQAKAAPDTQKPETTGKTAEGSTVVTSADPFADLDDKDTREWLTKREIKDAKSVAKLAHEQAKMLGNAIRIPGKDATPEEVQAYREKLGVPKTADEYEFTVPKDLPAELPYDGERASAFKAFAHEQGLSKAQAQAMHDWATKNAVGDFTASKAATDTRNAEIAKGEMEKLVKLWGPLDGVTAKANLAFADRALNHGGPEALAEFQRVGLIGSQGKVVMSAPVAKMLADFGRAVYAEDAVLKGDAAKLDNPFADGPSFNLTKAMELVKKDRETAISYIVAAGKKPEDFYLKA